MTTNKIDFLRVERLVQENEKKKSTLFQKKTNKLFWTTVALFLMILILW